MILNVLSHSFPWNPKSGSVPLFFPKQRWPAPRAFREKSTWIWRTSQGSIVTTDHIPDANVRRPTVNAIDQSIVTMVEWWRFTWKYLKNLVVYHHLSCFHMFPYVSTFFQYVTKHLPCLAPILEVSEMCSTGWAFFLSRLEWLTDIYLHDTACM